MWQNACFKAIFSVCLGTLIKIWKNLGPRNKLIIFCISLEWPRVLKNAAKMGVGLGIYLWNPTSNWSKIAYLKTKVDMLFFTIKHCQNFTLTKGHGAGGTVGKMYAPEHFWLENLTIFSYFGSLLHPSFTCQRACIHTFITPHTTILNGSRTGRLPVFISPWGY